MKIITGNLLLIKKGVIVHQVNNCGLMNAGVAKQIRNAYPHHYADYMHVYNTYMTQHGKFNSYKCYGRLAISQLLVNVLSLVLTQGFI